MTFTHVGRNIVRDELRTLVAKGILGTSGTEASVNDTALGGAVGDTELDITTAVGDRQLVIDYNLPATSGNGITFQEFGVTNEAGTTLFSRNVFSSLVKSSADQWQITVKYNIR